jgi:hypothetical protein
MVYEHNYHNSGHSPLSYLFFKTHFGDTGFCPHLLVGPTEKASLSLYTSKNITPHVGFQGVEMLTPFGGLFVGFINLIGVFVGIQKQRLALSVGPT